MASPQRFSEVTPTGDEPLLVEDFEILEEGTDALPVETEPEQASSGTAPWILLGLLVTGCTATVLLVGLPMHDEIAALRAEKHTLIEDLKAARADASALATAVDELDAARARLTATVAQKTVALDEALQAQADLKRALRDEIKKNEERAASSSHPPAKRRSRRR